QGIPPSGAQDGLSLGLGNLLVGNDKNEAGIEITMLGPQVRFRDPHTIALTGGDLSPKLNGNPVPMWETVGAKAGDLLSFGRMMNGCRAYLAVAGGIDVPLVLGSKATYARGEIGGHEGRVLRKGDVLKVGKPAVPPVGLEGRRVEPILLPNDAVSGGGFATIGTVIAVDLDRVGQSKTGDTTRFTSVRIDDGYRAWDERENLLTESSIVQGR